MNISDLLAPEAVLASLKAQTKKQLLQELAARAHVRTQLPEKQIFETLNERERLGTTGVGAGIAIPPVGAWMVGAWAESRPVNRSAVNAAARTRRPAHRYCCRRIHTS